MKIILGGKFRDIYFTNREAICMRLLCAGFSRAEITILLQLSTTTIEFYIVKMLRKTNSKSISELVENIVTSDFLKNYHSFIDSVKRFNLI